MRRAQEEHNHINNKKHNQREARIWRALCCSSNTRFSTSSSSSSSEGSSSERYSRFSDQHEALSSLTHYMVQEKLEQMIRERHEASHREKMKQKRRRRTRTAGIEGSNTKFIVMMAVEKCSHDPREDFRDSMAEMIIANRISDADDLRSLLEYYLSMNPWEYQTLILEIFHEVCTDLFLSS